MIDGSLRHGTVWAFVPAGLITIMLGGLLTMATIAGRDPGFALEPDYYAKAVRWDEQQAQQATNLRLGWQLVPHVAPRDGERKTTVLVDLKDARGQAVSGATLKLEAFANARAGTRITRELRESGAGSYGTELPPARDGLWELRFSAVRGSERFTRTLRVELGQEGK